MGSSVFDGKSILITGGTGSLGKHLTRFLFERYNPRRVVIFSRDEYKQFLMRQEFYQYDEKMRYFIGDVRDKERLKRAFHSVDVVIHAAAMKQVTTCEYNPIEAIKTNINGAMNVIDAAIDCGVSKVVALSTDKAVSPVNLYGGTKFVSDKLFITANAYTGGNPKFSVVRYGNVAGSRGSVIPFFQNLIQNGDGFLPITDEQMTRFWIDLTVGCELIQTALENMNGGEIYVSKISSFKIVDLAKAMLPHGKLNVVGIREGEKLHECMITTEDALHTLDMGNYYLILPNFEWCDTNLSNYARGIPVPHDFSYSSGENTEWLSVEDLKEKISKMSITNK